MGEVVTLKDLQGAEWADRADRHTRKVVLTNGCFDVLTPAHFDLLKFAAGVGEVLIVAVNSDEAVRALKGPNRPINSQADRAAALAMIAGVDYVVIFGTRADPSVESVVAALDPDILVKGGNYRVSEVVGRVFVEKHGGRVVMSPHRPGVSTTETLAQMETEVPPEGPGDLDWLVLVDMDGLLVDFPGEIIRRLCPEKSYADFQSVYDIGQALGLPTDLYSMVGPDFWEACPWMADGRALWEAILETVGPERVVLCSSPTHETSSPMGKLRWIEHHLGEEWLRRYIFTPCKWACAARRTVLIDDCDEQVSAFTASGGRAILVPRPWNSLWTLAHLSALDLLRETLARIMRPGNGRGES